MQRALSNLRQRLRDLAYRLGLPGLWRWWMGELAPLVPAAPRIALQRRRTRPTIEFADGEAIVWLPEFVDGSVKLTRVAVIPLTGDAAASAAKGRAAVTALAAAWQGQSSAGAPCMVVALPVKQVLRKQLVLPAAVEENLLRTLAYDLDRHTPFRPDQVYFDATVIGHDVARKSIRVDWAAALTTVVDGARRRVEEWGASVTAVVPGPPTNTPSRLNLLPPDARPQRTFWRQWQVWAPSVLVASIALVVVLVPLIQKRAYTIALLQQAESERVRAEAAASIHREFDRLQGEYNYVLAKKYAFPSTVQIIADVTRVLPDDTWLTQFEMKTTTKDKETHRHIFLRGESANGGKLITLLEDSKLVEQATLRSPTTKLQPGPGEVFDLGAELKAAVLPSSGPIGAPPATASTPPAEAGITDAAAPARPAASVPPIVAPAPATAAPGTRPIAPLQDSPGQPDMLFGPPPPRRSSDDEVFLHGEPAAGGKVVGLLHTPILTLSQEAVAFGNRIPA